MKLDRVIKEGFLEERVFKLRPAGRDEEPRDRKEWVKMGGGRNQLGARRKQGEKAGDEVKEISPRQTTGLRERRGGLDSHLRTLGSHRG